MTLNKEREEYNLVSYKQLEKIFIQCEKNSQLDKEISIDKNIEINSQIKLPVVNFMSSKNKMKDILKRKLKKFSCS
jgi:hypothetical protein